MRVINLANKKISDDSLPYIIAEVGANHQGDVTKCKKLIDAAKESGVDAVKLQKRNNKTFFHPTQFDQIYDNPNSFGKTYGLHREYLEFNKDEWIEIFEYANKKDLTIFSTAFDIESADFLEEIGNPIYKLPSGALNNIPLIEHIASFGKPMIISTGGGTIEDVDRAHESLSKYDIEYAILQCTSGYPVEWDELNLNVINTYKERYKDVVIGLSSHDHGIAMALVAYILGARIIEKHFTLNRALKGTDNAFSLEPQGMKKMIRDIKRASLALGDGVKIRYENEESPLIKQSTGLVSKRNLSKGEEIKEEDILIQVPNKGLPPFYKDLIIGKKVSSNINEGEYFTEENIEGI